MAAVKILAGKAALITGSTSGMGLEVLKTLAGAGANVAMHGLGDKKKLQYICDEVAAENGVKVLFGEADLRKPAEIRNMVSKVADGFGDRLDILVNNAGIQFVSPVADFPEDKWDAVIDVCLNQVFHTTKAALPYMKKHGWGRVISTGSMHSLVASPYKSAYNAAKHGVAGFTKTLALEVAQENITVNAVCPGYMLTDLVRNQIADTARVRGIPEESVINDVLLKDQPTKKFVDPKDVAALVLHLCGPHSSGFTGSMVSIDGGWVSR